MGFIDCSAEESMSGSAEGREIFKIRVRLSRQLWGLGAGTWFLMWIQRECRKYHYCLLRRRNKGAARAFYSHNVRLNVQRLWDIRCFMNFHIVQEVIRL